jgi:acyl carrier protein
MTQDWFGGLLSAPGEDVVTVRLRDAFGDDGMVGGCVITRDAGTWTVPLLMMSCRAMGRGVIDALLAWLSRQAARAGADRLRIPCVPDGRNVPLRLALAAAGFRVPERLPAVYERDLGTSLPTLPGWVTAPGEAGPASVADDLRAFLASATGRDELLHIPATAALFGAPVGLDSLTGTLLLREIERRFGVDVAGEDLNLDSLATLGTLAAFVAERARPEGGL